MQSLFELACVSGCRAQVALALMDIYSTALMLTTDIIEALQVSKKAYYVCLPIWHA
jgi:hypothetical protein